MRGKSYLSCGNVSMGIAGSIVNPDFFESYLGMRCEYVDMTEFVRRIDEEIYDKDEYEKALKWVKKNCKEGWDKNEPQADRARKDFEWAFTVKCALIAKDLMKGNPKLKEIGYGEESMGHNAIAGGFQGQRQWTDHFPNTDFPESILCSSFDWNGKRTPFVFATENDSLNAASMLFGHLLTNTAQIFSDVRTYWSPDAVKRVTGKELPEAGKNGIIHLINSGATCLDGTGQQEKDGKPAMKPFWEISDAEMQKCLDATDWCPAFKGYFRGGGYSSHFKTKGGMPVTMCRLNIVKGIGPVMQIAEGWTVELPDDMNKVLEDRTDPTWPTTWFAPRLTGKGAFVDVYSVMANWGANHGAISFGHIGAELITLCSMLRIHVNMHNVDPSKVFLPRRVELVRHGMQRERGLYGLQDVRADVRLTVKGIDSMGKYSIGIDYGTLSGRVLLVENGTGKEIASVVKEYTHGVMDEVLPDGKTKLEPDWALQYPEDYLEVLREAVPAVLKKANVKAEDVTGVGVDFTSCTVLPVDKQFRPLCMIKEYEHQPHAYVKLWKHHAAQDEADIITQKAGEMGLTKILNRFGGRVSSEFLLPKVWQVLNEAPELYKKAYKFIEAADWVIWQLTGLERRSSCCAGYKAMWTKEDGYLPKAFLKSLDPRLENLVADKLDKDVYPLGSKAGEISAEGAKLTGLKEGTAVGVAVIDAHAAVPGGAVVDPGVMMMTIGTSTCHMLLDKKEAAVPGIASMVEDGIIQGYYGYEAGQACVGDHFDWFIHNNMPAKYKEEAEAEGISIFKLLTRKAGKQKPGEHGLLALDWWNGNRSILMDADLSGLIVGCTLATKPEDIYRALVEATAYGTRIIIETFEESGIEIKEIVASGGIANKDAFVMQIYADVTNREIKIVESPNASALGAAIFGAAAAGRANGGYDSVTEAARNMARLKDVTYKPDKENVAAYDVLYNEYKKLYYYFGKENNVMKVLKKKA